MTKTQSVDPQDAPEQQERSEMDKHDDAPLEDPPPIAAAAATTRQNNGVRRGRRPDAPTLDVKSTWEGRRRRSGVLPDGSTDGRRKQRGTKKKHPNHQRSKSALEPPATPTTLSTKSSSTNPHEPKQEQAFPPVLGSSEVLRDRNHLVGEEDDEFVAPPQTTLSLRNRLPTNNVRPGAMHIPGFNQTESDNELSDDSNLEDEETLHSASSSHVRHDVPITGARVVSERLLVEGRRIVEDESTSANDGGETTMIRKMRRRLCVERLLFVCALLASNAIVYLVLSRMENTENQISSPAPTQPSSPVPSFAPTTNAQFRVSSQEELYAAVDNYMQELLGGLELTFPPIEEWDVSNVTDLTEVFSVTRSRVMQLFNLDISAWDVSRVTSLRGTFALAGAFNRDLTRWNVSRVTSLQGAFAFATEFNGNIGAWDVSNVLNLASTFNEAHEFNQDLSQWQVSKVTTMSRMFSNAFRFKSSVSGWDVSRVVMFRSTFFGAISFNDDLSRWNMSRAVELRAMFDNANVFQSDLSRWDTAKVTSLRNMFADVREFDSDLGQWDVSRVVSLKDTFREAFAFRGVGLSRWNTSRVQSMNSCFAWVDNNPNITSWDVSRVNSFAFMFRNNDDFNQDISGWKLSDSVDTEEMFLFASRFNQDLSAWNVSGFYNAKRMFHDADDFDQNLCAWKEKLSPNVWEQLRGFSNTDCE